MMLCAGARIKPKAISDPEMAEMLKKDYHFFACLAYIHQGRRHQEFIGRSIDRKIWMYNIDPLVLRSLNPPISGTTSLPPLHSLQCCDIFQAWWALLVKAGPFHEHSNQLWNISAVPIWAKVYTGKTRPN